MIDCNAQVQNDLIIEHIERMSENRESEYSDYSEMLETYWYLCENPININSDEIDMLNELNLINVFQLEKIKEYRKKFGDFLIIEELYEVEGLDDINIEILKPIICLEKQESNNKISIKDFFKYGKKKVMLNTEQCLNQKKGYNDIDDSLLYQNPNSIYLGSPQKISFRYSHNYKNKIEAGFILEKDPGEYIFKNRINDSIVNLLGKQAYSGFDFFSFHLHLKDLKFIKTLSIGDYKLSFGQGLTMGNGMSFVAKGESLLRRNKQISASKSANESFYLRGLASTMKFNNFELTTFYSYKNADAHIVTYDSLSDEVTEISNLQETGLHRTFNEVKNRRVVNQQLYGLNFCYKRSKFQVAYTLHKTDLSTELIPNETIYNIFYFKGKHLINQGIDFYYILDKFIIYGEVAMSDNKGFANLIGGSFQPVGYIDLTVLYRNYAKDYQCLYSNAFANGSNTRNEKGIYVSSSISIASNWKLITIADFFSNDFFKSSAYAPSYGHEFNSQLNFYPKKNTLLFLEFRHKNKMKNTSNDNIYQKYLFEEKTNLVRFHISHQISESLTLKNRAEYHFNHYEDGNFNSYLIYQDILYHPQNKPYSIDFRYELFNAEKGSVYAYENDIPYSFAIGSLSGKGIRTYINTKIKIINSLQFSAKIAFTIYDNKNEISSGLEQISSNIKCDAKAQLIWSL